MHVHICRCRQIYTCAAVQAQQAASSKYFEANLQFKKHKSAPPATAATAGAGQAAKADSAAADNKPAVPKF